MQSEELCIVKYMRVSSAKRRTVLLETIAEGHLCK